MPRALLDTTVLYAAAYQPDATHEDALPIVHGIDDTLGYLYAFDEDLDAIDDVYRLSRPTNPYEPESK